MNFKEQLIALHACEPAVRQTRARTLEECWSAWVDPEDLAWLVRRVCSKDVWAPMLIALTSAAQGRARQIETLRPGTEDATTSRESADACKELADRMIAGEGRPIYAAARNASIVVEYCVDAFHTSGILNTDLGDCDAEACEIIWSVVSVKEVATGINETIKREKV